MEARERSAKSDAEIIAGLWNGPMETAGVPFEAQDFLDEGYRNSRIVKAKADRMKSRVSAFKAGSQAAQTDGTIPQFFLDLHERRKAQNRVN